MKKKRRICFLAASAAVLAGAAGWIAWGNTALVQTEQVVRSERLPAAFSGYRIAHVSDLHNAQFGTDNEKLLELLRTAAPDCIAVTGDIVDSRRTDFDVAAAFMDAAAEIAPVYYVTGNHESRLKDYPELEQRFTDSGVTVLHSAATDIVRDDERIRLIGIDDPDFSSTEDSTAYVADALEGLADEAVFTVLLSHRPELFAAYAAAGVDLTLSGHAHGGQFRLPFIGGLAAPDQGLFPRYTSGLYTNGRSQMVVSRGLGNSLFPFRVNNRPEVVLITLEAA